jgi:secreted trypsin-like serine protease
MVRILLIILSLYCTHIFAGTINPNKNDDQYIKYGQKFIHTVIIKGTTKDGKLFSASGTLIKSKYVMTAAHVFNEIKDCRIVYNDLEYAIQSIICHKDFQWNNPGHYDIAIIELQDNINMEWFVKLYEDNNEVGKTVSLAGYGCTGNFIKGVDTCDLQRRAGSNIIDEIRDHLLITSVDPKKNNTSLEFLIASGDSGGGLYIDGKLAGIHSLVMTSDGNPNSDYNDEGGHTRVSIFKEWIQENTK